MHVLLASASPRRRQLLTNVGVKCDVLSLDVDERVPDQEDPSSWVLAVAEKKARAVPEAAAHPGPRFALTADTAVWLPGRRPLGKPDDASDARRMLRDLSGREHLVGTAFCWVDRATGTIAHGETVCSEVHMATWSSEDIDAYLATDEPWDKAGAYAIQGRAGAFVHRIVGDYFSIVGLPLHRVMATARALGITRLGVA